VRNTIWKTALALAVALMAAGCPIEPVPSDNALLQTLGVAGFSLDASFDPAVLEYTVLVPAETLSIALQAVAADALAKVEIDKANPASIPLVPGPNVIAITVSAENASEKKRYKLTVYRCNTTAEVLDSVNGSRLPATGISYKVSEGGSLINTFKAGANPQCIYIAPSRTVRVEACVTGRASDARDGFRAVYGADNRLRFISQKLEMSTFPAEAPTLDSFEYTRDADPTADSAMWLSFESGIGLDLNTVTGFRIRVSGKSDIEPTSWSGSGISLGIDYVPSLFQPGLAVSAQSSKFDLVGKRFHADAIFVTAGQVLVSGPHRATILVYDRANNRLERGYEFTISSAEPVGADISSAFIQYPSLRFFTYGLSQEDFSIRGRSEGMPVTSTGGTSYRAMIWFQLMTQATGGLAVPISGFHVARSTDGIHYADIGSINYGSLGTGNGTYHIFFDTDSSLEPGILYYYVATAFTDATHEKKTPVMSATLLPPFTASLVAPSNESTIPAILSPPGFVFTISNSALMESSLSDYFYLAPMLRQKDGTPVFYGEYRLRLSDNLIMVKEGSEYRSIPLAYGGTSSDYFTYHDGTVTLKPALFFAEANWYGRSAIRYRSGVTYEWDIFGNYTGEGGLGTLNGMNPMYFSRDGSNSVSNSLADIYQKGNQTLNGWFEFTVE
jgi:hypothetical protein